MQSPPYSYENCSVHVVRDSVSCLESINYFLKSLWCGYCSLSFLCTITNDSSAKGYRGIFKLRKTERIWNAERLEICCGPSVLVGVICLMVLQSTGCLKCAEPPILDTVVMRTFWEVVSSRGITEGGGGSSPLRNSEGPPISCQTQPDCENC